MANLKFGPVPFSRDRKYDGMRNDGHFLLGNFKVQGTEKTRKFPPRGKNLGSNHSLAVWKTNLFIVASCEREIPFVTRPNLKLQKAQRRRAPHANL